MNTQIVFDNNLQTSGKLPYIEVGIPGFPDFRTYIHGYSWKQYEDFLFRAKTGTRNVMAKHIKDVDKVPGFGEIDVDYETLAVYQFVYVCKTEPNGSTPTFVIPLGAEEEGIRKIKETLPFTFIKYVVEQSDALSMQGFIPLEDEETRGIKEEAKNRLGEILTDPEFRATFNVLSNKLFGKCLKDIDDETVGETLTLLLRYKKQQQEIIDSLYNFVVAMNGSAL